MVEKNNLEILDSEVIEDIIDDLFKIFGSSSNEYLTKNECRNILNIVFESLFDEKLKTKNFNYIFKLISKSDEKKILRKDFEPIVRSFIVCFDVNFITNSNSFNDKVCIKIGKHLLPVSYYIKKSTD
jgi:flagellar biosynthesis component FlhA